VDMAPRSKGRSSIPDKPVSDKTTTFDNHDGRQNHQEELMFAPCKGLFIQHQGIFLVAGLFINTKSYLAVLLISN
jgi:hypothetical protein